jgi:general secretion pathway protein A
MYTSFFGLSEKPFAITPDPRYLFLSERHAEALAHLMYGINESGGFIQLTGEVGTGKTTVTRTLLARLPAHADVALIINPRITPVEFLLTICEELGVPLDEADRDSVKQMVDALNRRLLTAHAEGRRVIVIVDEAQNLAADVLEQVRLLTNLETASQKLLQIILIGQPELRELLDRTELRQLAQRITGRYHLKPLSAEETVEYVRHRLSVAGANAEIFTPGALREVHRVATGIPRVINVICDRALLGAYTQETRKVAPALVRTAAGEVYGRRFAPAWLAWVATAVVLLGVSATAWVAWRALAHLPHTARAAPSGTARPGAPPTGDPTAAGDPAAASRDPAVPGDPGAAPSGPAVPGRSATDPGASSRVGTAAAASLSGSAAGAGGTADAMARSDSAGAGGTTGPPAAMGAGSLLAAGSTPAAINELLKANAANTTDAAAFRRLLSLWGTAMTTDRDPCGQAGKAGLACLDQRGSWAEVRALNRPAILTLIDDAGRRHRVVLSGLDERTATLDLGDHDVRVPLENLSPDWFGEFTVVWRPKTTPTRQLTVGMQGDEVRWLRRSLNALKGAAADPERGDVYDQDLAAAVQSFQRAHRLNADGIAGVQTQMVLDTVLAEPGSPLLSRLPRS